MRARSRKARPGWARRHGLFRARSVRPWLDQSGSCQTLPACGTNPFRASGHTGSGRCFRNTPLLISLHGTLRQIAASDLAHSATCIFKTVPNACVLPEVGFSLLCLSEYQSSIDLALLNLRCFQSLSVKKPSYREEILLRSWVSGQLLKPVPGKLPQAKCIQDMQYLLCRRKNRHRYSKQNDTRCRAAGVLVLEASVPPRLFLSSAVCLNHFPTCATG